MKQARQQELNKEQNKISKLKLQLRIAQAMLIILTIGCCFTILGLYLKPYVLAVTGDYGKAPNGSLTANDWNNLVFDFLDKSGDTMSGNLNVTGNIDATGDVCASGDCLSAVAAGAGDIDSVLDDGSGTITGGGASGDVTIGVDCNAVLGHACGVDNDTDTNTTYGILANQGLRLSGTNFGLVNTCANGELLTWNGAIWQCTAPGAVGVDNYIGDVAAHTAGGTLNMNGNKISMDTGGEADIENISWLVGYNDLFVKGNAAETAPIYYGASAHHFYTNSIERLTITAGGLVGINQPAPTVELDVTGDIEATGTICDGAGNCIGPGASYGVLANQGLRLSGTDFGLINTCANGELLSWNGASWNCIAPGSVGVDNYIGDAVNHTAGGNLMMNGNWISGDGGANEGIYIDNAGNVGIGTAAPVNKLHLLGNDATTFGVGLMIENTNGAMARWTLASRGDLATDSFVIRENNPLTADRLTIQSGGNIGIGVTAPTQELDVAGDVRIRNLLNCDTIDTDASGNLVCGVDNAGAGGDGYIGAGLLPHVASAELRMNGKWISGDGGLNEGIYIDNAGQVGIGTIPSDTLHVAGFIMSDAPGANPSFHLDDGDQVYTLQIDSVSNNFRLVDNTAGFLSRIVVNTAGNVGVGATAPVEKLEVRDDTGGTARIRITDTAQNPELQLQYAAGNNHWAIYNHQTADELRIWNPTSNDVLTIAQDGTITASGQICDSSGCIGSGSGLWTLNGTNIFYNGGNVGINVVNPGQTLDVGGSIVTRPNMLGELGVGRHSAGLPDGYITARGAAGQTAGLIFRTHDGGSVPIRMKITWDGNVGIGTETPGTKLEVNGDVTADAFIYSSDISLKENIEPIDNALDKVLQLEGVEFTWKENGEENIGLIAQDVEEVFPEAVVTNEENGLKYLQYGNLIAPLIEAIKEQQAQINELKAEIEKLK